MFFSLLEQNPLPTRAMPIWKYLCSMQSFANVVSAFVIWSVNKVGMIQRVREYRAHRVGRLTCSQPPDCSQARQTLYRGRLQSQLHAESAESVESVLSVSRPGYREFIVRAWHYAVGLFVVGVQLGLQRVSAGVSVLFSQNQQVYCNPTRQPNNRQYLWACLV